MGLADRDYMQDRHSERGQTIHGPSRESRPRQTREFDWGKLWWGAVLVVLAVALIQEVRWARGDTEPMRLWGAARDPCNTHMRMGASWMFPVEMDSREIVAELNAYRAAHGRSALRPNALLDAGANKEARFRARQSHLSEPEREQDPFGRNRLVVTAMGEQYRAKRTLVAVHWSAGAIRSERALIDSWAACPGTNEALLDHSLTHVGFSSANGEIQRGPLRVSTLASVMWLSESANR